MEENKLRINKYFLSGMSAAAVFSMLLVALTMFDGCPASFKTKSIVLLIYPIICFSTAVVFLASAGQLHLHSVNSSLGEYKYSFGAVCVMFAVIEVKGFIDAIFNPDDLYFDDRWQALAQRWVIFIACTGVCLAVNRIYRLCRNR